MEIAYITLIPMTLDMRKQLKMISLMMKKQINLKFQSQYTPLSPQSSQIKNTLIDVEFKERIMRDYFREGYDG